MGEPGGIDRGHRALTVDVPDVDGLAHRGGRDRQARFRLVLRKAGLPAFRLYDLRHTHASHLIAEGAPITYVAAKLEHTRRA